MSWPAGRAHTGCGPPSGRFRAQRSPAALSRRRWGGWCCDKRCWEKCVRLRCLEGCGARSTSSLGGYGRLDFWTTLGALAVPGCANGVCTSGERAPGSHHTRRRATNAHQRPSPASRRTARLASAMPTPSPSPSPAPPARSARRPRRLSGASSPASPSRCGRASTPCRHPHQTKLCTTPTSTSVQTRPMRQRG